MRIVYLNPVGALGGAERSLLDMMASVRQAMPAADLSLVVATAGPLIEEAEKIGLLRMLVRPAHDAWRAERHVRHNRTELGGDLIMAK